nr:IncF plasmid conjugative transfer pilus assembly protein TraF [Escherichia coli]
MGWQWYNEKITPKEKENKPVPAAPVRSRILCRNCALQTATKSGRNEAHSASR